MKKSILAIVVLLLSTTFIVNAEVVQVVTGTATPPTGTSFTFTASDQTIHYQFIYPASLFKGTTSGSYKGTWNPTTKKYDYTQNDIYFEYINGIKLYTNWTLTGGDGAVNNLGFTIVAKAWTITTQTQYSSTSASFLNVPQNGAVTFYDSNDANTTITIDGSNNTLTMKNTKEQLAINPSSDNVVVDLTLVANSQISSTATKTIEWKGDNTKTSAAIISTIGLSSNVTNSVQSFLPQTDFICGRVIKDVLQEGQIYNAKYDLRTTTSGITFEATLLWLYLNSSPALINYQLTYSDDKSPANRPTSTLRGNTLTLVDVNFKDGNVNSGATNDVYPIYIIGNNAFSAAEVPSNCIIELPTNVIQLGHDSSTPNKCFYIQSGSYKDGGGNKNYYDVTFYLNSYPAIVGSNTDSITNRSGSDQPNSTNLVFLNLMDGEYSTDPTDATWTDAIKSQFNLFKYSSPLYNISFDNDYDLKGTTQRGYAQNSVYTIQYPYNETYPMEFTFNSNIPFRSYDGTDHYFNGFNDVSFTGSTGTQTISGSTLTCTLDGKCIISIVSKFDARLEYQSGTKDQKLDAGDLSTYANNGIWLSRANSLVFGKQAENRSPEFEYTNSNNKTGAPTYLTTTTPVCVEKIIDNEQYQFFSMPFDVNVEDIVVTYDSVCQKDNNGKWKSNQGSWNLNEDRKLKLLADSFHTVQNINNDSYVIYEYIGQGGTNGETALYKQVITGTLQANKGYAFVIAEKDGNYNLNYNRSTDVYDLKFKVMATIKFKDARNGQQKNIYMNTYNGFKYTAASAANDEQYTGLPGSATLNGSDVEFPILIQSATSARRENRNWNLVGNPFLHTVRGAAFGKYVTTIGADNVNQNQAEYVNKNVAHHSVYDSKNPYIQPFQAFFIQAVTVTDSTNISPITINPNTTEYQSAPAYVPMSNRPEVISLNILLRDTIHDFTAVINANSRGKEFKIGDDLGKMFNPCAQICTYLDSTYCSFKELDIRNNATLRTIPLGISIAEEGDYTFAIDTTRHYFYGAVMLHDKQMNQYHNLTVQGTQFHLTKGMDVQRFELVVEPSELPSDVEAVETSETLDAYVFDGKLVVDNIAEGSTLSIFDASGRMLYTTDAAGSFNYQFSARGVYVVVLQGNTTGSVKVVY